MHMFITPLLIKKLFKFHLMFWCCGNVENVKKLGKETLNLTLQIQGAQNSGKIITAFLIIKPT